MSKKEIDFTDWVSILKEFRLHYTKEGVLMINRIISQMNNNILFTSSNSLIDRDLLLRNLKVILDGGLNYEHNAKG